MMLTRTLRALAPVLAVGVLLLQGAPARADVRANDSGGGAPALAIRFSPAGPWSLVGPLDPTVLNPAGDAFGDGLPEDAPQGGLLLAAWVRPDGGQVHLSRWEAGGWTPLAPLPEHRSVGRPRVDALGSGWAVTWQQDDGEPLILGSGVGQDGEHFETEPLINGWLVDETWLGELQLVLHYDANREHLLLTGVLWSVPGVPSPVDIVFVTKIDRYLAGPSEGLPAPRVDPAPHPGNGKKQVPRGAWARRATITWWDDTGELRQSIVDDNGDLRELAKPRFAPASSAAPEGSGIP